MGECNSTLEDTRSKNNNPFFSASDSKKPSVNFDFYKNNPNSKPNPNDYILPKKLAKRDDVTKYYRLSSQALGSGATGQVYLGIRNNQKYAIKRINKSYVKYLDEMKSEAQIALSLNHRNIMKCYEIYEDPKFITHVMELGEGGDLFDFIVGCPLGHLPDDIAVDLLLQMCDVVDFLHQKGLVHRDLKPENFIISIDHNNRPLVKLIDFGLCVPIPDEYHPLKSYVGTPEYCAPEIVKKIGYREKVDEWAMGVIMYNMLTGLEPFNGRDREELNENISCGIIQFERIKNANLRQLCMRFLERSSKQRITCREAIGELNRIGQYFARSNNPRSMTRTTTSVTRQENRRTFEGYWNGIQSSKMGKNI